MLCDDYELHYVEICCAVALLLLRNMRVNRMSPLLFSSDFRVIYHFSLQNVRLSCQALKTQNIVVREKPRRFAVSEILELHVLAPIVTSHSKSLKVLIFPHEQVNCNIHCCFRHVKAFNHQIRLITSAHVPHQRFEVWVVGVPNILATQCMISWTWRYFLCLLSAWRSRIWDSLLHATRLYPLCSTHCIILSMSPCKTLTH